MHYSGYAFAIDKNKPTIIRLETGQLQVFTLFAKAYSKLAMLPLFQLFNETEKVHNTCITSVLLVDARRIL